MGNQYAAVRKNWRAIDTKRDLRAIWRGERFEAPEAVNDALRVYELAIRVDGWDAVKSWAREALKANEMLHAHVVELAMRAIEQRDEAFFQEITRHLLDNSAPQYFRFWHTLFSTRHTHFGERQFRLQLAELSDFRVVKYRRWVRAILRKLRFRCKTDKERAIGAIAFGMYKTYDRKAYPSEMFDALIACHKAATTRSKAEASGKPVPKRKQMEAFTPAAEKLGIWSVTEGIRTSAGLPRTLGYLTAMAPRMTDGEILRGLRAFDDKLKTADHKKASENVVRLAQYMVERLGKLDEGLASWAKIYPYMVSPTLQRVLEDLMDVRLQAHLDAIDGLDACPVVVVPQTLEGRSHRASMLTSYALYRRDERAAVLLADTTIRALFHPSKLFPHGYGFDPPARRWQAEPDRPHRVLYQIVKETFGDAAKRRASTGISADIYLRGLRAYLLRKHLLDGAPSERDVPVLFFAEEPSKEDHMGLAAHLSMFVGAVLVLFDRRWEHRVEGENLQHVTVSVELQRALQAISEAVAAVVRSSDEFARRRAQVHEQVRHLAAAAAIRQQLDAIPQGPWRDD